MTKHKRENFHISMFYKFSCQLFLSEVYLFSRTSMFYQAVCTTSGWHTHISPWPYHVIVMYLLSYVPKLCRYSIKYVVMIVLISLQLNYAELALQSSAKPAPPSQGSYYSDIRLENWTRLILTVWLMMCALVYTEQCRVGYSSLWVTYVKMFYACCVYATQSAGISLLHVKRKCYICVSLWCEFFV